MKRTIFTACMAIAFLTASAQSNPYIVKTKGAKKSAESHMADVIAEAQQFSTNVCQSINNSVDLTFADEKKQELDACLKEMEEN